MEGSSIQVYYIGTVGRLLFNDITNKQRIAEELHLSTKLIFVRWKLISALFLSFFYSKLDQSSFVPIDESPFLHTLDTCNKEVRKRLNFSFIGKKNFMKMSKRLKIDEKII